MESKRLTQSNPAISSKTNILTLAARRAGFSPRGASAPPNSLREKTTLEPRPKPAGNVSDRVKCCHRGDLERPSKRKKILITRRSRSKQTSSPLGFLRFPKLFDNQTKLPSPPLQPRTAVSGSFKHSPMSPPSHPVDSPKTPGYNQSDGTPPRGRLRTRNSPSLAAACSTRTPTRPPHPRRTIHPDQLGISGACQRTA